MKHIENSEIKRTLVYIVLITLTDLVKFSV